MTSTQLNTLINYKAKTDDTTFTQAEKLVLVNLFKDEIASKIADIRPEAFNIEQNDNLVADTRTYAFKTTVMNNLIRVEFLFATGGSYVIGRPTKLSSEQISTQESQITQYYDNNNPAYFIRDKYIYILSGTIVSVTNGIKWVFKAFPADLANLAGSTEISTAGSATSLGFPREFQELLARRVVIEYKARNNITLNATEANYGNDLQNALDAFSVVNIDEQITGFVPASNKQGDHGDFGFNF